MTRRRQTTGPCLQTLVSLRRPARIEIAIQYPLDPACCFDLSKLVKPANVAEKDPGVGKNVRAVSLGHAIDGYLARRSHLSVKLPTIAVCISDCVNARQAAVVRSISFGGVTAFDAS